MAPHGSTVPTCGDGNSVVVLGKLIPTFIDGVNFLSELYQKELSYSAINTARAALSAVIYPLRDARLLITPWWPTF